MSRRRRFAELSSLMNAARPPILEIRGLRKRFGDVEVLRGIDLSVQAQELVFVIGPSGSGKSTLLRCCNRLEEPSAGSIRIDGTDIMAPPTNVNAMRRQIGMVFQSFNLYPHMTALRMSRLRSLKCWASRAPRRNASVWLRSTASALPTRAALSRRTLGRTAAAGRDRSRARARAQVMLFDEPTSALDPELVGSVLDVMRELQARRHDHAGGQSRDALRPRCGRSRDVHGSRADRGAGRRRSRYFPPPAKRAPARSSPNWRGDCHGPGALSRHVLQPGVIARYLPDIFSGMVVTVELAVRWSSPASRSGYSRDGAQPAHARRQCGDRRFRRPVSRAAAAGAHASDLFRPAQSRHVCRALRCCGLCCRSCSRPSPRRSFGPASCRCGRASGRRRAPPA